MRKRRDGRCYLDVEWKEYDAACEIHGIPHLEVVQWDDDLDRANDVVVSGPRLLIFSSFAIRHRQDRVADQVERLLRRGGWRGTKDDAFGRDVSAESIIDRRTRPA